MSNKRKRAVRARQHAHHFHHMTNRPDAQDAAADPALTAGLETIPISPMMRRPMMQALRTLNLPAVRLGPVSVMSTPEGCNVAEILIAARRVSNSTLPGLARRFKRSPDTLTEFSAAWRLDADRPALQKILRPLWKQPRGAE